MHFQKPRCIVASFINVHAWQSSKSPTYWPLQGPGADAVWEGRRGIRLLEIHAETLTFLTGSPRLQQSNMKRSIKVDTCLSSNYSLAHVQSYTSQATAFPHLLHPAQTVGPPWGSSSCRWLVPPPSAPPADPPEPTAESSVSPVLESIVNTDTIKAQNTLKRMHFILHNINIQKFGHSLSVLV